MPVFLEPNFLFLFLTSIKRCVKKCWSKGMILNCWVRFSGDTNMHSCIHFNDLYMPTPCKGLASFLAVMLLTFLKSVLFFFFKSKLLKYSDMVKRAGNPIFWFYILKFLLWQLWTMTAMSCDSPVESASKSLHSPVDSLRPYT